MLEEQDAELNSTVSGNTTCAKKGARCEWLHSLLALRAGLPALGRNREAVTEPMDASTMLQAH